MEEHIHRKRDILIKTVTAILTLTILIVGLVQYGISNERDYIKVVYDNQFRLYEEILEVSAQLAITPWDSLAQSDPIDFSRSKKEFLEFYYGKMILVEDSLVQTKMIEMKTLLFRLEDSRKDRINVTSLDIRVKSTELSLACRKSLEKTWGIELEVLKIKE